MTDIDIGKAVRSFSIEFKKNPFNFWSEYDLQVLLSNELTKQDELIEINIKDIEHQGIKE